MLNNKNPINKEFFILCLLGSGILVLGISNQSLWIDEAWTAWFASHKSIASLISTLKTLNTSDIQTPLYLFYIQGWAQVFGISEYALRLSNLPFALLLVTALGWTSRVVFKRAYLWVGFCSSPFIWFYMNEARPYMATMAFGTVSLGALLVYLSDHDKYANTAPWLILSSLLIGCGFNMLVAFLLPALLVLMIFNLNKKQVSLKVLKRDWMKPLLVYMPLLTLIGGYYIWTVINGAGGIREKPGIGNIAFAFYEFMGFMGLGPPRNLLRIDHTFQSFSAYWAWLLMGIVALLTFVIVGIRHKIFQKKLFWAMGGSLFISSLLFFIASYIVTFRFLGRHLAVLFPMLLFLGLQLMNTTRKDKGSRYIERIAIVIVIIVWIISDIRMLALPEYYKDDYRKAARITLEEIARTNGNIVWAADAIAGRYYGIHFESSNQIDVPWPIYCKGIYGANWNQGETIYFIRKTLEKGPIILVLSKADIFDVKNGWKYGVNCFKARLIASPNAFNIYEFWLKQR